MLQRNVKQGTNTVQLMVFYPGREFKEPDGTVRTETRYTYSEYIHTLWICLLQIVSVAFVHVYWPCVLMFTRKGNQRFTRVWPDKNNFTCEV